MSSLSAIQQRLEKVENEKNCPITSALVQQLKAQQYRGAFEAEQVQQWCAQFALSPVKLALYCVPISACYARVPVSNFYVGAVAIGQSGKFYFGANQEYAHAGMGQTVHAEQSAISHAWLAGETAITDMVVNTTPCGHCRQFMNELNTAKTLKIHLPHSQNNLLHSYLPNAFGPKDLGIEKVLLDEQQHSFSAQGDTLAQAAVQAAQSAYAPYSQAVSGVALQVGSQIICGRYAENAAFNPSFLPLQGALNYRRFMALEDVKIERIVMAEKSAILSHRRMTEELAKAMLGLEVKYIAL